MRLLSVPNCSLSLSLCVFIATQKRCRFPLFVLAVGPSLIFKHTKRNAVTMSLARVFGGLESTKTFVANLYASVILIINADKKVFLHFFVVHILC